MEAIDRAKIAVVADWVTDMGGAERVLSDILAAFPQADLYTSVFFPKDPSFATGHRVFTSFLQRLPFFGKRHKLVPSLRRHAFETFDLSGYDLVVSSSSAESKGVVTRPGTVHVCYCHTPTRYLWSHAADYLRNPGFGALDPVARFFAKGWAHRGRVWDWSAARRVDHFLANSRVTRDRIAKYYGRSAQVLHPAVHLDRFQVRADKGEHYAAVGRVVPYKRFDLLVDAFNGTGRRLTVVAGTRNAAAMNLVARSGPNIEWVFGANDAEVRDIVGSARALLFPQEEDFGIVPLEAQALGTPVVAYAKGGALETVKEGVSGTFFPEQSPEALRAALDRFEGMRFDPFAARAAVSGFGDLEFRAGLREFCSAKLAERAA